MRNCWQEYSAEGNRGNTWGTYYATYMMVTSWNLTERYQTLTDYCESYHRRKHFPLKGNEELWSHVYCIIPMLCRLDLVNTEQINYCELAVIWPQRSTVEIQSTEVCISTGPLKHGGTPWISTEGCKNTELVLKLRSEFTISFMEAVKG